MAKKKNAGTKRTASKARVAGNKGGNTRAQGKSHAQETAKKDSFIKAEIISIIVITASLFMLISLFTKNGGGAVGRAVNNVLLNMFGIGAYILPFSIIATCLVIIFADGLKVLRSHIIMLSVLFVCVISAVHIFGMDETLKFETMPKYMSYYYTNGSAANGGLFGAVFGNLLYFGLGSTGSFILLVTVSIIMLILITGRSFFALLSKLRKGAGSAISNQRKRMAQKRILSEETGYGKGFDTYDNLEEYDVDSAKRRSYFHKIEKNSGKDVIDDGKLDLINERLTGSGSITVLESEESEQPQEEEDRELLFAGFFKSGTPTASAVADEPAPLKAKINKEETTNKKETDENADDDFEIKVKGIGFGGGEKEEAFGMPDLNDDDDVELPSATEYEYPPIGLLTENDYTPSISTMVQIKENSRKLESTLRSFGVEARVVAVSKGPTVTRYELAPGVGVKVNKISGLADDLALSLAAMSIRIEAPIPGKSAVGIELPNKETQPVLLREVLDSPEFINSSSRLTFSVGKDIAGNIVVSDIAKMPHLLIAGSTGSGKSVCINTLITSLLYKSRPDEVKLLMIDPKVVELSVYNGIPHLLIPVVTDPKKAAGALNWAVIEMEKRYAMLAGVNVRDLKGYNQVMSERGEATLPQIVIIIDELADLMMSSGKEVEEYICRIAQKARAAGIHLIIATQRPSVNVITGTIKANVGSRLAFAVTSGIDSRTILDQIGAERLLGKGDMLFSPMGLSKPQRIQGCFISDKEVENIVAFLKERGTAEHDEALINEITSPTVKENNEEEPEMSDQFLDAVELIFDKEKASTSMLQRYFRIGYNSAARLIEEIEKRGIIGPEDGSKPRKILMTRTEWEMYRGGHE